MPKLFMFYVGGDVENSNIELHDVRFSMGSTPQACYNDLRSQWWGTPKSLHIDSWAEISHADGYDITLSQTPVRSAEKLYFLNLGGYTTGVFEEVHSNILVVAKNQRSAIQKAIRSYAHWKGSHKDALMELEKTIDLSNVVEEKGVFLHLIPSAVAKEIAFTHKYIRL